ncbi:MAG: hypothetical protein AAFX08_08085 [Pseudomonadota bacterium]
MAGRKTKRRRQLHKRLNLIRFAFGFRDHAYFKPKDSRTGIDLAHGNFATAFKDAIWRAWTREELLKAFGGAGDGIKYDPPADATVDRWLRGETDPGADQYPGIAHALNWMLSHARTSPGYLKSKGVADEPLIAAKFSFDAASVDPRTTSDRELAEDMGFDIGVFDEWWDHAGASNQASKLSQVESRLVGFYHSYRLHAEKDGGLQQDVILIKENDARDGLRALMVGNSEPPWRGDLVVGRNTASSMLIRSNMYIGTQVNTISLAHVEKAPGLLFGFRSRIIEESSNYIAAYRMLLVRAEEPRYQAYLDEDIDDIEEADDGRLLRELSGMARPIDLAAESVNEETKLIADILREPPRREIADVEYDDRASHNIFGLTRQVQELARRRAARVVAA